jgi:predicted  nucleic acid-binding Zn-ribbon protein
MRVRRTAELKSLREIRTMQSSKKRSIPRTQTSAYLDLYVLRREKDRLEKEIAVLERRKRNIQERLGDIGAEMRKIEKKEAEKERAGPPVPEESSRREWKKIPLKY